MDSRISVQREHIERVRELSDRGFSRGQAREDRASGRIGQGEECGVECGFREHYMTVQLYNVMVIY